MITAADARRNCRTRTGGVLLLGVVIVGVIACRRDSPVDEDGSGGSIDVMEALAAARSVTYLSQPFKLCDLDVAGANFRSLVPEGGQGELHYYLEPAPGSVLECEYTVGSGASLGSYLFSVDIETEDTRPTVLFDDVVEHTRGSPGSSRRRSLELSSFGGAPARLVFKLTPPASGKADLLAGWSRIRLHGGAGQTIGDRPPAIETAPPTDGPDSGGRLRVIKESASGANLIVVAFDAARADRFGCYGYSRPTTPNTDRLAAESLRFDRAYCQAVYTVASTGTLMTGLFPMSHGAVSKRRIFDDLPTLAVYLQRAGFVTASFTANHNAGQAFGFDRGFETNRHVNYDPARGERIQAVSTPELFDPLVGPWLSEHRDERFFVYIHLLQPHLPFAIPAAIREDFVREGGAPLDWTVELVRSINHGAFDPSAAQLRYLNDLYDANLAYADGFLGDLTEQLETLGIFDRSIIVVLSDHGEALFEHGKIGHNNSVYEETVRIPMLIRLPPPAGREIGSVAVTEPVGTIDVVPTILDILGLSLDEGLQGESLLPFMAAAAGEEAPADGRARPTGDEGIPVVSAMAARFVVSATSGNSPSFAFIRGDEKLILRKNGRCELYDLASDPGETVNLAARNQFSARITAQQALVWLGGVVGETPEGRDAAEAFLDPGTREDLEALGYLE